LGGCLHLRPPNQNFWGGRVPPVPPIIAAPDIGDVVIEMHGLKIWKTRKQS